MSSEDENIEIIVTVTINIQRGSDILKNTLPWTWELVPMSSTSPEMEMKSIVIIIVGRRLGFPKENTTLDRGVISSVLKYLAS